MIESWRVGYGLEGSSPPQAPAGATTATKAAIANTAPIRARGPRLPLTKEATSPRAPPHRSLRAVPSPLAAAGACLALLLAACGGSGKQAAQSPPPPAQPRFDGTRCAPAKDPGEQTRDPLK